MSECATPDLRIIDEAIRLVYSGLSTYTCHALISAAISVGLTTEQADMYRTQYRRFVLRHGLFPRWWNEGYDQIFVGARIAALKEFKKACIDAAKVKAA